MSNKDIERSLGRVEGKVDSLIEDIKSLREAQGGRLGNLDKRVAGLEKRQYTILTIASGLFIGSLAFIKKFI